MKHEFFLGTMRPLPVICPSVRTLKHRNICYRRIISFIICNVFRELQAGARRGEVSREDCIQPLQVEGGSEGSKGRRRMGDS